MDIAAVTINVHSVDVREYGAIRPLELYKTLKKKNRNGVRCPLCKQYTIEDAFLGGGSGGWHRHYPLNLLRDR